MKIFLVALLVAVANAQYGNYYPPQAPTSRKPAVAPAPKPVAPVQKPAVAQLSPSSYAYDYKVADEPSGVYKSAAEQGNTEKVTGEYTVHQPDGCIRHVSYVVDQMGYQPTVTYSGPCDPTPYQAPVIPTEQVELAKQNLAKAAADAAKAAAEYQAVADHHKKIAAEHERMKGEIAAAEMKKEKEQAINAAINKAFADSVAANQVYTAPAVKPTYQPAASTGYDSPKIAAVPAHRYESVSAPAQKYEPTTAMKPQSAQIAPVQKYETAPAAPIQKYETAPAAPVQKLEAAPAAPAQKYETAQAAPAAPAQKYESAPAAPVQKYESAPVAPVQKYDTAPVTSPQKYEPAPAAPVKPTYETPKVATAPVQKYEPAPAAPARPVDTPKVAIATAQKYESAPTAPVKEAAPQTLPSYVKPAQKQDYRYRY